MRKSALSVLGLVVACLVALGLTILWSASEAPGVKLHGNPFHFLQRQTVYLVIAVVLAVTTALVDYHVWRDRPMVTWIMLGVVFLLLLAVFPPLGKAVKGSYRWIRLGPINLQPSEFAKIAVVIVLAMWMDTAGWGVELFKRGTLVPLCIIGFIALPVLCEPDFGSVMVIGAAGLLVMFVAGARIMHFLPIVLAGLAGVGVVLAHNENRMRRLFSFMKSAGEAAKETVNPQTMDAASYQAHMALVAIKNGGLFGLGLRQSYQKQYYLPEAHTDFIFAIGAEELGLGFSIGVILLFIAFFAICIYIAGKASDRFGRYLVIGMSFIIFFQAFFNIGVVCEALPTKGMALPFFSYGGTNLMSSFFALGTIFSVGIHSFRDRKRAVPNGV